MSLFDRFSFLRARKPKAEMGIVNLTLWGQEQWSLQCWHHGKLLAPRTICPVAPYKPLEIIVETSGPAQEVVCKTLRRAETCILLLGCEARPADLWPADAFAALMRRLAGIFPVKGGWLYVIESDVAGFIFAILDRKGKPLEARAISFRNRRICNNIYAIDELKLGGIWTGNRNELGWKPTAKSPRHRNHAEIYSEAQDFYFKKINPELDHAIVGGPDDPIIATPAPVFMKGSLEQLEALLRDVAILSYDEEPVSRVMVSCGAPYRAFVYNRAQRISLSSRAHFIERVVLEIMRPAGESLFLFDPGEDKHRLKSGYKRIPWVTDFFFNLALPTGHEKIAASRRLRQWLTDEARLTADQATKEILWLSGGKK